MAMRCAAMACLVAIVAGLCGCGSSGTGPRPGLPLRNLSLDSPAGSRIAFTALYHANIVRLSEMGYAKIAFQSDRDGDWEVYVMNRDGSGETNLSNNASGDGGVAWSPDGSLVTFVSHREGNGEIFAMRPDGSDQTNLTNHLAFDDLAAWCPTPSVKRSLIGAAGSDGGSDPPFGAERPLAVVGMTSDGLVSAATVEARRAHWTGMRVEPLGDIGTDLAGLKIVAYEILNVQEDMGRAVPPRVWDVSGATETGTVLAFFSGATGKITSVIAASDSVAGAPGLSGEVAATIVSSQVVLRGSFAAAFSADDPGRNLIAGNASEVTLDGRTGEVVAVH